MGIIQAREPMIRKEGVRPPLIACEALSIPSVPFQKHPAQPPTDHSIVGLEDVPKTVPKVVEPPLRRASEPVENYRQRVARFLRRQLADAGDELSVALRSWKPQPASERIAQKRKALLPRVHDVCFLGMQCQPLGLHPPAHLGQRRFGFFRRATQDDKVIRVAHHLKSEIGHPMVQGVEIDIRQHGRQHRALRHTGFRRPLPQFFQNPLVQKLLHQAQHTAIRDLLLHSGQQSIFRNRLVVLLHIRVDNIHIPGVEPFLDAP